MQVRRHLARWTAWFVLLNIAVGFCDCLRDPVSLPIHSNSSAALTTTSHHQGAPDSDCGDNCESCVCHASILIVEPVRFAVDLAVSRLSTFAFLPSSDPDHVRIERPPIA
jgi:hypothetical protein